VYHRLKAGGRSRAELSNSPRAEGSGNLTGRKLYSYAVQQRGEGP
jgi:hypothetical protein